MTDSERCESVWNGHQCLNRAVVGTAWCVKHGATPELHNDDVLVPFGIGHRRIPAADNGGECPGCHRFMSVRERDEQGVCNDCQAGVR